MDKLEIPETDPALTLRDIRAWLQHFLDTNVKYIPHTDNSGHPHGWSVVQIPDWSVRQKLENLTAAIEALKTSA